MKTSLRLALIAQFLVAALVPTVIVAFLLISSFRDIQVTQQIEKQQIQADNVAMTISHDLDQAFTSLKQMSEDANVALSAESGIFGYSARSAMSALHTNHPLFAVTLMLDTKSFVVEAAPEAGLIIDAENVLASLSDEFEQALNGQKVVTVINDSRVSRMLQTVSQRSTEPSYQSDAVMVMMAPLFVSETEIIDSRSKLTGVLISFVLVQQLREIADLSTSQLELITDSGQSQQGLITTKTELALPDSDKSLPLLFAIQEDVVLVPVNDLVADYAGYAALATLLILAIGWLFVRLELKPIAALNRIVKQYSAGDLSPHREQFPFEEFNDVAQLLSEMADNLNRHQLHLENRVAERTQELESALANVQQINKELIRTQRQLIESEKSSQIGVLVAGVAHEINTPVGICVTASSVLEDKLTDMQERFEGNKITKTAMQEFIKESRNCADILSKNLERAAELIHSFKAVSVDQSSERDRVFNVNEYLKLVLRSLRNKLIKQNVVVSINGDETLVINSYPGCLSQILTNLIINSMKHGFTDDKQHKIAIAFEYKNGLLCFVYEDDGVGADEETVNKLFEPFYTTKRNQGGSGLGLSVVYNLVTQKLQGDIRCHSADGEGLTTIFSFPAKHAKPDRENQAMKKAGSA